MALGGRPRIDGGHIAKNLSIDLDTLKMLDEARQKGKPMSHVVEKCVKTMAKQLDPGPACEVVAEIDRMLGDAIDKARVTKDYAKLQALAQVADHFEPYARVCEIKTAKPPEPRK
jgi:hypothetical protein